jgi:hypothetical protein
MLHTSTTTEQREKHNENTKNVGKATEKKIQELKGEVQLAVLQLIQRSQGPLI